MYNISQFSPSNSQADELQAIIYPDDASASWGEQMESICQQKEQILGCGATPVFERYFISDAANQMPSLREHIKADKCAVSVVQQPPLCGAKVALWLYAINDVEVRELHEGFYEVMHGAYKHYWAASSIMRFSDSEEQTIKLLNDYADNLQMLGMSLADNCVRTWFFVHDIDSNYAGMVKGRNMVFDSHNLTRQTHYIASTGIGGRGENADTKVLMDAYAVDGLKQGQMKYLYAKTNLNRTSDYGVAFERGTYVDYGDRRHVFISGTASIDNNGNVLYINNIRRQTQRMWDNVEALLAEAEATWSNVQTIIVYLRDIADYAVVKHLFDEHMSGIPYIIVQAPVCRPAWLIEMECIAVVARNTAFETF